MPSGNSRDPLEVERHTHNLSENESDIDAMEQDPRPQRGLLKTVHSDNDGAVGIHVDFRCG